MYEVWTKVENGELGWERTCLQGKRLTAINISAKPSRREQTRSLSQFRRLRRGGADHGMYAICQV